MADFRVQGTDLPKGSSQQLEEGYAFAGPPEAQETDAATYEPGEEDLLAEEAFFTDEAATDELDEQLFSPTDHPERPLTHGAPFGPGADFVASPLTSEQDHMNRVAQRVLEAGRQVPDDALLWATRVLMGE